MLVDQARLAAYIKVRFEDLVLADDKLSDYVKSKRIGCAILETSGGVGSGPWVCHGLRGLYTGECRNGVPHGMGTWLSTLAHSVASASVDEMCCDKKAGDAHFCEFKHGSQYVGWWRDGFMEGHGEFIWPDRTKYLGHFREGKPSGHGTRSYSSGDAYEGEWFNGREVGTGVFRWRLGAVSLREYDSSHALRSEILLSVDDMKRLKLEPASSRERPSVAVATEQVEVAASKDRVKGVHEEKTCQMCLERPIQVLLIPCGHLFYCSECWEKENSSFLNLNPFTFGATFNRKSCPVCKERVESVSEVEKIYC